MRSVLLAILVTAVIATVAYDGVDRWSPEGGGVHDRRVLAPSIMAAIQPIVGTRRAAFYAMSFVALVAAFALLERVRPGASVWAAAFTTLHYAPPFPSLLVDANGAGYHMSADLLAVFFAAALAWAAHGRRWLWWYLALAIGCLNRESVALLVPLALAVNWRHGAASAVLSIALLAGLRWIYPGAASDNVEYNLSWLLSFAFDWQMLAALMVGLLAMGMIPFAIPRDRFAIGCATAVVLSWIAIFLHANFDAGRVWNEVGVLSAVMIGGRDAI